MNNEIIPFIIFVIVATFSPGPGNISSMSIGLKFGYKKSFNYLLGISTGYSLIMLTSAFISTHLLLFLPKVEPILRVVGACYIFWLAVGTFKNGLTFEDNDAKLMRFKHGFLIQVLNPKAIIFGITIYTTFLVSIIGVIKLQFISVFFLSFVTFLSVSLWSFVGDKMKTLFKTSRQQTYITILLVLLLIYCGLYILGVFK